MPDHDVKLIRGDACTPVKIEGAMFVRSNEHHVGAIVYGPYERREPGRYVVEFSIGLAGGADPLGDPICAIVDVTGAEGTVAVAERRILVSHLSTEPTKVVLAFTLHAPRTVEYRVLATGQAALVVGEVVQVHRRREAGVSAGARDRTWRNEREFLDGYLRNVAGVIHVGANTGQERRYYWLLGLNVIWVEPITELYEQLVDNLGGYDRQRPVNALLADEDDKTFEFKIANNGGASSSILDLQDHATIFPDIRYVETRKLVSMTLKTLMAREGLSTDDYQALTLDVEGAELLVLQGARSILHGFRYVKCEVADFPARSGTPTVAQLDDLLKVEGFVQIMRRAFAMGPGDRGTFWDIVWKRVSPGEPLNDPCLSLPFVAHHQDVEGIEKVPD